MARRRNDTWTPDGIRTRDLHFERVMSWALQEPKPLIEYYPLFRCDTRCWRS
jgi:hypothetical protein